MTSVRRSALVVLATLLVVVVAAAPSTAATPTPRAATVPSTGQAQSALAGSAWLASQLQGAGYIGSTGSPATPNLSFTANAVLALASAQGASSTAAARGLAYLEANVQAAVQSPPDAGNVALLILDAHAMGGDPTAFGGVDLVTTLLATQRTTAPDPGLFGVQDPTYNGVYRQGLGLAALAAAGVTGTPAMDLAITWLRGQQCPDGGWPSYQSVLGCTVDPVNYVGPDTNSTALAALGLVAQGTPVSDPALGGGLAFLQAGQDADAGWGFFPHVSSTADSSDPNSTGLVIQALASLGQSVTGTPYLRGAASPISLLQSFQVTSGSGAGAFTFPGVTGPNLLATYQAVPALAGVIFPFRSTTTTASVAPVSSAVGTGATYSATVTSPGATPSGEVTFVSSGTTICSGTVSAGSATCTSSAPPPSGGTSVLAVFTGSTATGVSSGSAAVGYWMAGADGGVFAYGGAPFEGSHGGAPLGAPIVGIAATPDGKGYWLAGADGGVFAYGDAAFLGSLGGRHLNRPIVGVASSPDGGGYWLVGADGGVFAFGDAGYQGSMGGTSLNRPIVGMAASATGGYWLVASDGGVFAFGGAGFHGSTGGSVLREPVAGMSPTPDSGGYWLVAADGGVFAFGDATFRGAAVNGSAHAPVVGMSAPSNGNGYWLAASDGGVFGYGVPYWGGLVGSASSVRDVVAITS